MTFTQLSSRDWQGFCVLTTTNKIFALRPNQIMRWKIWRFFYLNGRLVDISPISEALMDSWYFVDTFFLTCYYGYRLTRVMSNFLLNRLFPDNSISINNNPMTLAVSRYQKQTLSQTTLYPAYRRESGPLLCELELRPKNHWTKPVLWPPHRPGWYLRSWAIVLTKITITIPSDGSSDTLQTAFIS